MRLNPPKFCLFLVLFLLVPFQIAGAGILEQVEKELVSLADKVRPAVVSLSPYIAKGAVGEGLPRKGRPANAGSGVIFDGQKGLIVTNSHVVRNVLKIQVTFKDGRKVLGEVLGSDEDTDLAVVKIPIDEPLIDRLAAKAVRQQAVIKAHIHALESTWAKWRTTRGIMPKCVILPSFIIVGKYGESFREFLEPAFSFGIIGILIGMVLSREGPVCLANFFLTSAPRKAQDIVVVPLLRHVINHGLGTGCFQPFPARPVSHRMRRNTEFRYCSDSRIVCRRPPI